MLLKRRGAEKRESYGPVSLHPFSGVIDLRCRHLGGFWISWTPPAERSRQIYFVVLRAVSVGRHRNCLGDVPFFAIERPIHNPSCQFDRREGTFFLPSRKREISLQFWLLRNCSPLLFHFMKLLRVDCAACQKRHPNSRSQSGKSRARQAVQQNRQNHQREDHIHTVAFDGKGRR